MYPIWYLIHRDVKEAWVYRSIFRSKWRLIYWHYMPPNTLLINNHLYQFSNTRRTQFPSINVTRLVLHVVGAAPTGDAPTTSEWSTMLLPTKVRLMLKSLRFIYICHIRWALTRTYDWFMYLFELIAEWFINVFTTDNVNDVKDCWWKL